MKIVVNTPKPALSRRLRKLHREATRDALRIVGEEWVTNIAPKHFTQQGAKEYGYAKRKASYFFRKLREKRTNAPLFWSGRSKESVLTKARVVVKRDDAIGGQVVRIVINAPALNYRNTNNIDMRKELTAVSDEDRRLMQDTFTRAFEARFTKRSAE